MNNEAVSEKWCIKNVCGSIQQNFREGYVNASFHAAFSTPTFGYFLTQKNFAELYLRRRLILLFTTILEVFRKKTAWRLLSIRRKE